MGNFCYLYIGATQHEWKSTLPEFVSLLFEPDEYTYSVTEDNDETICEHKLLSTCGKVAHRIKNFGIDLQLLRKLHFHYFCFDLDDYYTSLMYKCETYIRHRHKAKYKTKDSIDKVVQRMTSLLFARHFVPLDKDAEFAKVLGAYEASGTSADYLTWMKEEFSKEREKREAVAAISSEQRPTIDWVTTYREWLTDFLRVDPYLTYSRPDSYRSSGSDDLDALYQACLSIFASNPEVPIEFNFTEFVYDNDPMTSADVYTFLDDLRRAIHARSVFGYAAFGNFDSYKLSLSILNNAEKQKFYTTKQKGDFLEDLVAQIFVSEIGFTVKQKVKRSGEEIDLVIINKVDDPFWNALQSPVILIECKYQKNKVEPKDLRNFEVKILDRRGLCRLGIIISVSGFTKGCYEAITRSSRDGHRIVLIDSDQLQRRINDYSSTAQWLEDIIVEQL